MNYPSPGSPRAMQLAMFSENINEVRKALKNPEININHREYIKHTFCTPLERAIMAERKDIVKLLLKHQARLTPKCLYLACSINDEELVRSFLTKGVEINGYGNDVPHHIIADNGYRNDVPLHIAAAKGYYNIAALLIQSGADLNNYKDGTTALNLASSNGHPDIVTLLIESGADINHSEGGKTALYHASSGGHRDIVELLLTAGANVHIGHNPLVTAAQKGFFHICQLLIDYGADVDKNEPNDKAESNTAGRLYYRPVYTPIHHAAVEGHLDILKLLHNAGANMTHMPFMQIVEKQQFRVLHYLAENGQTPDPNLINKIKLLNKLCDAREWGLLTELLRLNVEVSDDVILTTAIRQKKYDVCSAILAKRTDFVNALPVACQCNDLRAVRILLEHGVNPNSEPFPMEIAYFNSFTEIIEMLVEYNADVHSVLEKAIHNDHRAAARMFFKSKALDIGRTLVYCVNAGNITLLQDCLSLQGAFGITVEKKMPSFIKAIRNNRLDILQTFVTSEFIRRDDMNTSKESLIHISLDSDIDIMMYLISNGTDVNRYNADGETPLLTCYRRRKKKHFQLLLHHGAHFNLPHIKSRSSLLLYAIQNDDFEFIQKYDSVINYHDARLVTGETALHLAVKQNLTHMLSHLIEKGLDVNEADKAGNTPIILAARNGYLSLVKLLIEQGAKINTENYKGENALYYASLYDGSDYTQIQNILIKHGAVQKEREKSTAFARHPSQFSGIDSGRLCPSCGKPLDQSGRCGCSRGGAQI